MDAPSVSVIVVNWNSGRHLRECVESLRRLRQVGHCLKDVVVVDNASTDGSLEGLESTWSRLQVVRNRENAGFAKACNQGADATEADYLLFLNPDVRLSPDSLGAAVAAAEEPQDCRVGIVGIRQTDERGVTATTCSRHPTPSMFIAKATGLSRVWPLPGWSQYMTDFDHGTTRYVDQVMGSFFLVRSEVFRALEGFDERFFVYFEEVDFSVRAKKAGFHTLFVAGAVAIHVGGASSSTVPALRLCYSIRSRLRYADKHFSKPMSRAVRWTALYLEFIVREFASVLRFDWAAARSTFRGYMMLWRPSRTRPGLLPETR